MLPTLFDYEGKQLRTIIKDGEPWFVAKDVCDILGLEQVSRAMDRLDEDERGLLKITHPQSADKFIEVNGVNEPGLYQLIIASSKPEAKTFKRWITHEVIPQIRKTGTYSVQPKLPQTYAEALRELADAWEENQAMLPKANYFDNLVERNLLMNFRDTAKELKIREGKFIDWLLEHGYVYRDAAKKLKPYAKHVPDLFQIKEWGDEKKAGNQTLITPKGRETFRLLLEGQLQPV